MGYCLTAFPSGYRAGSVIHSCHDSAVVGKAFHPPFSAGGGREVLPKARGRKTSSSFRQWRKGTPLFGAHLGDLQRASNSLHYMYQKGNVPPLFPMLGKRLCKINSNRPTPHPSGNGGGGAWFCLSENPGILLIWNQPPKCMEACI